MVSNWMSMPSPSMSAMRSAPSARPPACRSNGVPFTTSATPSTVQCECTSMTVTRLPPIEICLRGPAGAAAPPARPPRPPPRCASAGNSRPATYAPAAAPAIVLKKSLRFCICSSFTCGASLYGLPCAYALKDRPRARLPRLPHAQTIKVCGCGCPTSVRRCRRKLQQLDQIAPEDGFFLRVVQQPVVQDRIRVDRPWKRHLGAVDDLPDAHFRDHVAQPVIAENHRVGHDLRLEVLVHRALLRAARVGLAHARAVGASHVGRQIPAGVRAADLYAREFVERSVVDQV